MNKVFWLVPVLILAGCANPLNQATYSRYMNEGIEAFNARQFTRAEAAFARAADNVDWGNLGDDARAGVLYNLGDTKRILRKYDEAESLLLQAQAAAAKAWSPDSYSARMLNSGFVLLYLEKGEPLKGWPYVQRSFGTPDSTQYGGNIRWTEVYADYERELARLGHETEAKLIREEIERRNAAR